MDAAAAFARYEELRPRLPKARFPKQALAVDSLLDIADQADVFVFAGLDVAPFIQASKIVPTWQLGSI